MPDLLSVREIANYFGVHTVTVYRWIQQGLPNKRIGAAAKTIRFDIDEVNQWMQEQKQAANK